MSRNLRLNDWTFEVSVTPAMMIANTDVEELCKNQSVRDTLQYVADHQDEIQQRLMKVIREQYNKAYQEYGEDQDIPVVENDAELKELLVPLGATIHDTAKNGYNYIGFGFDCSWEEEHGIGILMHKDRIVQYGGEDHAFLEYMAEDDAKLNS